MRLATIGAGMMEIDQGSMTTLSLGDSKLPTSKDIPSLRTVLVQEPIGPVPFQGEAIGESSIISIAAAIVNAVRVCEFWLAPTRNFSYFNYV